MELTEKMTDWRLRNLFEIIRTNFSKFYNPSEIQGKGIIQTVHPEKTLTFRHQNDQTIRLYTICI